MVMELMGKNTYYMRLVRMDLGSVFLFAWSLLGSELL